jgi:hypothetical protein
MSHSPADWKLAQPGPRVKATSEVRGVKHKVNLIKYIQERRKDSRAEIGRLARAEAGQRPTNSLSARRGPTEVLEEKCLLRVFKGEGAIADAQMCRF